MIPGKVKVKLSAKECEILKNFTFELLQMQPKNRDYQTKLNLISLFPLYKRFSVALLFPKKELKFSIPVNEALAFLLLYQLSNYSLGADAKIIVRQFVSIIDKSVI